MSATRVTRWAALAAGALGIALLVAVAVRERRGPVSALCRAYRAALEEQTRGIEATFDSEIARSEAQAAMSSLNGRCRREDTPECRRDRNELQKRLDELAVTKQKLDQASPIAGAASRRAQQRIIDAVRSDESVRTDATSCLHELAPLEDRRRMAIQRGLEKLDTRHQSDR